MTVSIHEAKTQLSKLLDLLERGEDIVIRSPGTGEIRGQPQFGTMLGEIEWQEGREKPMTPEETDAFWEGR